VADLTLKEKRLRFETHEPCKPGSEWTVVNRPALVFRGYYWTASRWVLDAFVVKDIVVGNWSELAEPNARIPFDAIATEEAVAKRGGYRKLDMSVVEPGREIRLVVENVSGEPVQFKATLWGVEVV
jgi:hypothetical protein